MIKFIAGFLSAFFVLGLGGYLFLILGGIPLGTKNPPLPLEEWVANKALEVHLRGSDQVRPIIPADRFNLVAGAKLYAQHCAVCHGGRSGGIPMLAKGMFPPPPQLLKPDSWAVGYPAGSVYKMIHEGVRLSGMPAFGDALNGIEIWQLTLMLGQADQLPPGALEELASQ